MAKLSSDKPCKPDRSASGVPAKPSDFSVFIPESGLRSRINVPEALKCPSGTRASGVKSLTGVAAMDSVPNCESAKGDKSATFVLLQNSKFSGRLWSGTRFASSGLPLQLRFVIFMPLKGDKSVRRPWPFSSPQSRNKSWVKHRKRGQVGDTLRREFSDW